MASGDQGLPQGQRRAGIIRRGALLRSRTSSARNDWLALVGVGFLAVIVLVVLANVFGGVSGTASESPSATPGSTLIAAGSISPSPTISPEPTSSPSPTASPSPSPSPPPSPSPSPSTSPSPSASPSPSPTAAPTATPAPTPPSFGLIILEPPDGATVDEHLVVVRGLARPGSIITRDIPFWFDDHTPADALGRWSFAVSLAEGENVLTFRVGDDASTARQLTVTYRER